jgi:hypothetical protein
MESRQIETRWRLGDPVPGVGFARDAHVRILEGPFLDECARVRDVVVASGTEPCYRVEVDAAHVVLEVAESSLSAA